MHLNTRMLGSFVIGTCMVASLAIAGPGAGSGPGQGHGQGQAQGGAGPKPGRLGVPTNVMCHKTGDQLTLSWNAVEGATQYRVYLEASDGGELVDTVAMSPYMHPLSDMTDDPAATVEGHVRALGSKMGRDASRPSAHVPCE